MLVALITLAFLIYPYQLFIIDNYTIHEFMREHDLRIYEHIKYHLTFGLPVSRFCIANVDFIFLHTNILSYTTINICL